MKKTLFTLTPLLFILMAKAQKIDTLKGLEADTLIFTSVQKPPEFKGGIEKFYRFLSRTVRYPAAARENNTQGTVIISMLVEKDGSLARLKVVRGIGDGCDEEALRVLRLSPKWNPGTQNGRAARVMYSVPISFTLAKE